MKLSRGFVFKTVSGILLMALLLAMVDLSEVLRILPTLNLTFVAGAILLMTADRVLMSYKWNILLRAMSIRLGLFEVVRTYYIGNFIGTFLPATVGLDVTRAWRLARHGHSVARLASSIVVERAIGMFVLSLFSLAGMILLVSSASGATDLTRGLWLNVVAAVGLAGAMLLFALALSERGQSFIERQLSRLRGRKFVGKINKGYAAFLEYRDAKGSLVGFTALTFVEVLAPILEFYLIGLALGIEAPFVYFLVVTPVYLFLARLPVTPNVIGVQEGLIVILFSFAGVAPAEAFTMGFVRRIAVLVALSPGLAFYLADPLKGQPAAEGVSAGQPVK